MMGKSGAQWVTQQEWLGMILGENGGQGFQACLLSPAGWAEW